MNAPDLQLRLRAAKTALTRAAAACLRNEPGAAELANVALAEVESLQAQLKASRGRTCSEPGCSRFTLRDRCDAHRPPDPWGEARARLDELQDVGER